MLRESASKRHTRIEHFIELQVVSIYTRYRIVQPHYKNMHILYNKTLYKRMLCVYFFKCTHCALLCVHVYSDNLQVYIYHNYTHWCTRLVVNLRTMSRSNGSVATSLLRYSRILMISMPLSTCTSIVYIYNMLVQCSAAADCL